MIATDHWLWRLAALEWIEAAERELELGRAKVGARRTAITHARRAAGMALNGVLVDMATRGWSRETCETAWGRSYIDHLRAIADEQFHHPFLASDPMQAERCRTLLAIPVMPPTDLIRLGRRKAEPEAQAIEIAAEITHSCSRLLGSPRSGEPGS